MTRVVPNQEFCRGQASGRLLNGSYYSRHWSGVFLFGEGGFTADEQSRYQQMTRRMMPKRPILRNAVWAFFVGGAICEVGQVVQWFFVSHGMSEKEAASPTAVVMIGLGALFTGLGWYDRVVKRGGMGGSLPITGFANAMVAPAMEFKTEGLVMGVGARLFSVAGPVLVYGMTAAFVVGAIRYLLTGVA